MTATATSAMTPREAAIASALRSAWITFTALASGFLAGAAVAGALTSPSALLTYAKATWFAFLVAQVVGPLLHAGGAYKVAAANPGAVPPIH